jgi:hypothetical protein
METHRPTHESRDHGSYSGTSRLGMAHIAAHFLGLCAAMRTISGKSAPSDAPLALLMERIAAHFGCFSTNEPANEPTKTQGIDERTHQSDERTQDFANEPEARLVAPMGWKAARLLGSGRPRLAEGVARPSASNPRPANPPKDPKAIDGGTDIGYYSLTIGRRRLDTQFKRLDVAHGCAAMSACAFIRPSSSAPPCPPRAPAARASARWRGAGRPGRRRPGRVRGRGGHRPSAGSGYRRRGGW